VSVNQTDAGYLAAQNQVSSRAHGGTGRKLRERAIEFVLFLCALSSVAITLGIVWVLLYESWHFFANVSLIDFLTDTQ